MIKDPRTYWESKDFDNPYQMGGQKHRLYLLDLLKRRGVKTLLDVGCGTGPIYDLIVNDPDGRWDNITKYKGTDYSRQMIETARREFPHGDWEVQDARRLTEKDNSWDCVLLMHALDHIDDYASVIKESARVASKYVLIVLWRGFVDSGTHLNDRNRMGKAEGEPDWEDTYLQEYSRESLENEFKKNGLLVDEIAEGEQLNGDYSHYNFLFLLRKNGVSE